MYVNEKIELTPSDFAEYCYCGIKWAYSKSKWAKEILSNPKYISEKKLMSAKYKKNLKEGQKNESLCINYIDQKHFINEIVFNGTGNRRDILETKILYENKIIYAKPDLIARVGIKNEVNLYEFKAVSKKEYLEENPFESVKAQIWLYHYLKNIKINNYYLLRYFKNPTLSNNVKLIKIDSQELLNNGFKNHFVNYMKASKKISKDINSFDPSDCSSENNILFNPPSKKTEKWKKCSECNFNFACQYNRFNWNKKGKR